jgi:hypothetical protein
VREEDEFIFQLPEDESSDDDLDDEDYDEVDWDDAEWEYDDTKE